MCGQRLFQGLVLNVLVYHLPLLAAQQLSPPPADMSALYSPISAKAVGVAEIIQIATYVLAALALSLIAGSLAAGELCHLCLHRRRRGPFKVSTVFRAVCAFHPQHFCAFVSPGSCMPRPHFLLWRTVNSDAASFRGGSKLLATMSVSCGNSTMLATHACLLMGRRSGGSRPYPHSAHVANSIILHEVSIHAPASPPSGKLFSLKPLYLHPFIPWHS